MYVSCWRGIGPLVARACCFNIQFVSPSPPIQPSQPQQANTRLGRFKGLREDTVNILDVVEGPRAATAAFVGVRGGGGASSLKPSHPLGACTIHPTRTLRELRRTPVLHTYVHPCHRYRTCRSGPGARARTGTSSMARNSLPCTERPYNYCNFRNQSFVRDPQPCQMTH